MSPLKQELTTLYITALASTFGAKNFETHSRRKGWKSGGCAEEIEIQRLL